MNFNGFNNDFPMMNQFGMGTSSNSNNMMMMSPMYGNQMGMNFLGNNYNPLMQQANNYGNVNMSPFYALYQQLDRNGNGVVTSDDFAILAQQFGFGNTGQTVARIAFSYLDKNKNGVLEFDEVMRALHLKKH